ncbi:TPA: radical SAM protein [Candidatus Geothermarchaeota archaeon]|nr:radical SAM protein [Candidatus Geothermarchaeota archaeon]
MSVKRVFRWEGRYYLHETILPEMDYSINPYFGCEIGCRYCYSIYYFKMKKVRHRWGEYVEAKQYLPKLLTKNLGRFKKDAVIGIGTYSDPYQPWEREIKLTRRIIKILRRRRDLHLSIQTRYPLIIRDMDLILSGPADIGTSIPSIDRRFIDVFEPLVPSPEARLKMLEKFSRVGVDTWLYIAPIIPYVNDDPSMFRELIYMARDYGVDTIYTDIIRFRVGVKKYFMEALEEYRPDLIPKYRDIGRKELYEIYDSRVKVYREIAEEAGLKYIDAAPMMFRY